MTPTIILAIGWLVLLALLYYEQVWAAKRQDKLLDRIMARDYGEYKAHEARPKPKKLPAPLDGEPFVPLDDEIMPEAYPAAQEAVRGLMEE